MSLKSRLKTIVGDDATVVSGISRLLFYIKSSGIIGKLTAKILGGEKHNRVFKQLATDVSDIKELELKAERFRLVIHFNVFVRGSQPNLLAKTQASLEQQLGKGFVYTIYENPQLLKPISCPTHYALFLEAGDELSKDALMCLSAALNAEKTSPLCLYFNSFNSGSRTTIERYTWSPDTLLNHNYINHACVFRLNGIFVAQEDLSAYERCYQLLLESARTETPQFLPLVLLNEFHVKENTSSIDRSIVERWIEKQRLGLAILPGNKNPTFSVQYPLTDQPLVSIVIPTKNKSELVKQCVDSIIQKSTHRNIEILLIDNRSDEKELLSLVEQYATQIPFKHVYADIDFNFAALMNLGNQHANGSFLVFLNNDTEIITPQWLEYMLGYARQKHVGAVGCKLLYPDHSIQHAGVVLDKKVISKHVFLGSERYAEGTNAVTNYPAVTAACMMVEKQKFIAVGGFDESFNVEYNDIDLCLKLRKAGYHNVYLPQVELFHYESASRRHPFSDKKNHIRHIQETQLMRHKWRELFGSAIS